MADRIKGCQPLRPYLDRKKTLLRRVQNTMPLTFLQHTGLIASRPTSPWWWKDAQASSPLIGRALDLVDAAETENSIVAAKRGGEKVISRQMLIPADTLSDELRDAEVRRAAGFAGLLPNNEGEQHIQNEVEHIKSASRQRRVDGRDVSTNALVSHRSIQESVGAVSLTSRQSATPEFADVTSLRIEGTNLPPAQERGLEANTNHSQLIDGNINAVAMSDTDPRHEEPLKLFEQREGQERDPMVWVRRLAKAAAQKDSQNTRSSAPLADNPTHQTLNEAVSPWAGLDPLKPAASRLTLQSLTSGNEQTLSMSARRMLIPLVGIDPATVRIHEHGRLPYVSSAGRADAIAVADTVVIGPNYRNGSPEHLGLIAHELTHVARGRHPRFIPPVAAGKSRVPGEQVWSSGTADEEKIAQVVENRVRGLARNPESHSLLQPSAVVASYEELQHTKHNLSFSSDLPKEEMNWAGLPAPWQSLPKWRSADPGSNRALASNEMSGDHVRQEPVGGFARSLQIHAASPERVLKDGQSDHVMKSDANAPEPVPGPDPEQLAREVYDALKRRLAAERRRNFR